MQKILAKIPTLALVIMAIFLGLAPITQEPHLWQKLNMLFSGTLIKPIDIFDLIMHGTPLTLLILKFYFIAKEKKHKT